MKSFNAALLSLVLIASAMNVLAAPTSEDSKRSISMSINAQTFKFPHDRLN